MIEKFYYFDYRVFTIYFLLHYSPLVSNMIFYIFQVYIKGKSNYYARNNHYKSIRLSSRLQLQHFIMLATLPYTILNRNVLKVFDGAITNLRVYAFL